MRIRDALESDAETLAAETGRPADALVNTIHDRTVRVATADGDGERDGDAGERDGGDGGGEDGGDSGEYGGDGGEDDGVGDRNAGPEGGFDAPDGLDGFVAFDVRGGTVHVTDIAGTRPALERLIEEPKRFAEREGMDVEALVVDGEQRRADALADAGFVESGPGPRFDGDATTRFRFERDG